MTPICNKHTYSGTRSRNAGSHSTTRIKVTQTNSSQQRKRTVRKPIPFSLHKLHDLLPNICQTVQNTKRYITTERLVDTAPEYDTPQTKLDSLRHSLLCFYNVLVSSHRVKQRRQTAIIHIVESCHRNAFHIDHMLWKLQLLTNRRVKGGWQT